MKKILFVGLIALFSMTSMSGCFWGGRGGHEDHGGEGYHHDR